MTDPTSTSGSPSEVTPEPTGLRAYVEWIQCVLRDSQGHRYEVVGCRRADPPSRRPGSRSVHYFTARVKALPNDREAPQRQDVYLRALDTLPNVRVHKSKFMIHKRWRFIVRQPKHFVKPRPNRAHVLIPEEKGSDVNLASHLLRDAFRGEMTRAFVFTNDSYLVTPVSWLAHKCRYGRVYRSATARWLACTCCGRLHGRHVGADPHDRP